MTGGVPDTSHQWSDDLCGTRNYRHPALQENLFLQEGVLTGGDHFRIRRDLDRSFSGRDEFGNN